MIYIGIDTNQWIFTAKGQFSEILFELEKRVDTNYLEVLTNKIILDEWERNKEDTLKAISNSIKSEANSAIKLLEHISDTPEKKTMETIILNYKKNEEQRISEAKKMVQKIDDFLFNKCRIIEITQEQKLSAINFALEKRAPMHNNKNNIADTIIFLNFIEEMERVRKQERFAEFIFVSHNTNEYSGQKRSELHENLKEILNFELRYFNTLPEALNLSDELIQNYHWYFVQLQEEMYD